MYLRQFLRITVPVDRLGSRLKGLGSGVPSWGRGETQRYHLLLLFWLSTPTPPHRSEPDTFEFGGARLSGARLRTETKNALQVFICIMHGPNRRATIFQ